ncbi:hypothetical protein [Arabidopsis thaliana]|uniref:Uncharacterized protein AT4g17630 n=1 Tax=Arabidopsis thaliana TaxID=3702 RepID=O23604_ARATH|nr:hypothetical protein [Arabidopsis thaliana]CAB78766.1 hypothetical protein [Arabidopsis thaliana]
MAVNIKQFETRYHNHKNVVVKTAFLDIYYLLKVAQKQNVHHADNSGISRQNHHDYHHVQGKVQAEEEAQLSTLSSPCSSFPPLLPLPLSLALPESAPPPSPSPSPPAAEDEDEEDEEEEEDEEALPEEDDFEREDRESLSESSPNKSSIGFFFGGESMTKLGISISPSVAESFRSNSTPPNPNSSDPSVKSPTRPSLSSVGLKVRPV